MSANHILKNVLSAENVPDFHSRKISTDRKFSKDIIV